MLFKVYETPFFFGAVQYSSLRPQFVVFHLRFRRSSDACKVEGRPGGGVEPIMRLCRNIRQVSGYFFVVLFACVSGVFALYIKFLF